MGSLNNQEESKNYRTTSKTEIDLREIGRKLRVEQKCRWLADAVSQNIDGGSTEMGDGKCSDLRRKADEGELLKLLKITGGVDAAVAVEYQRLHFFILGSAKNVILVHHFISSIRFKNYRSNERDFQSFMVEIVKKMKRVVVGSIFAIGSNDEWNCGEN
ncbi:unnamed protein product [Vicia faba]|uniref:Uncharacterized protein n=1 Tax=Vicia faba TaxID=3906 RepID=A0AAV0YRS7_VICFA|nr:unnamed protein product [Vicia faba]